MKRLLIEIFVFLLLIGCNDIDYKPKYKDFDNDWERENLLGKVKKLEQYKANVADFETGNTDKPFIVFRKEFIENGNISYQENFDIFGEIEQFIKNIYDKNGFRIESISENFILSMKSIEKAGFDTATGKKISAHVIYNDTLKVDAILNYDSRGNLIQQTNIQNGDTMSGRIEYQYDGKGRILIKRQIDKGEYGKNETTNEFKYNSQGDLIELISKSDFSGEMKSIYEYDGKNRIQKISEYESEKIEKESLFDKFYNKTLVRFYVNNALQKEMKYKYRFDKKGNWIQKDVFMKENPGDKKIVPIYTETRTIEYFK